MQGDNITLHVIRIVGLRLFLISSPSYLAKYLILFIKVACLIDQGQLSFSEDDS